MLYLLHHAQPVFEYNTVNTIQFSKRVYVADYIRFGGSADVNWLNQLRFNHLSRFIHQTMESALLLVTTPFYIQQLSNLLNYFVSAWLSQLCIR